MSFMAVRIVIPFISPFHWLSRQNGETARGNFQQVFIQFIIAIIKSKLALFQVQVESVL